MRRADDEILEPEVERELEAIDRALAGEPVDPDLAELATAIRDERPEPDPDWREQLDRRAAEGFGRAGHTPLARLGELVRPRSLLAPTGAAATLAVVVVIAGSVLDGDGGGRPPEGAAVEGQAPLSQPEDSSAEERRQSDRAIAPDPGADRTAPRVTKRREDRSAALTLQTTGPEVRDVSDGAVQITESAGGVVRSSSLTENGDAARAALELSIPTRELDSTLDQLTDLATVKSLNEGAVDITRPFISARDRLEDARAERRELLRALGNASTDAEIEAIRQRIRDARREISRAEAAFDRIARRARFSQVSVQVIGSEASEAAGWSLGDAADDALAALKVVAGVLLIAAATFTPLALLATITYLITKRAKQTRRNQALDS